MPHITHDTVYRTVTRKTWQNMRNELGWIGTEIRFEEETGEQFGLGPSPRFDEQNSWHSEKECCIVSSTNDEIILVITPEA